MHLEFKDVQTGTVYEVGDGGAVLGRERARTDIPFRDESISKRHARIFPRGGQWYLEDLDSSNGTYLRNERIFEPVVLRSGSAFSLAQRRFEVVAIELEAGETTGRRPPEMSNPLGAILQVVLHYLTTLPRLLVLPFGLVRESIDEPDPPGRGPIELALLGAIGGAIAGSWGPLFASTMAFILEGRIALEPSATPIGVAAVVGAGLGVVWHFAGARAIRILGGASDRDARSRLAGFAFSAAALFPLPIAAARVLTPLDPVVVTVAGWTVALWVAGVGLFASFRWARSLGVYRWVEISLLAVGLLAIAVGSASAIRRLVDFASPDSAAPPDLATPRLEVPAEVVAPEPPAAPSTAPSPPTELRSEYLAYVEARKQIESILDAEPERLREPELRAAYAELIAAEARIERAFDSDFPPPIRRRLLALRRFEATGAQVQALAARLRPPPKP